MQLSAMATYLTHSTSIKQVMDGFLIPLQDLSPLSYEEDDLVAEFETFLSEFRRVARQLEADRKVVPYSQPQAFFRLYGQCLISRDVSVSCKTLFVL